MQRYIIIRFGQAVITLLGVSVIVFTLVRLTGSPVDVLTPHDATTADIEQMKKLWGLDKSLFEQYFVFLSNVVQGDFGPSFYRRGTTAMSQVMEALPNTLQLAGFAIVISVLIAVPIGVITAVKKDTPFDWIGKTVALLGQSLPSFWLAIVLIWTFSVRLGWTPVAGMGGIKHMILPSVALGWFSVAAFMRLTRSAMLTALDSEYMKFARIKGIPGWKVVWKHGFKNASIPPLTLFSIIVGTLVTGFVTIEVVFAWPGVGMLALQAVRARDYAVIQAIVLLTATMFIALNLIVDILYAYLDPRIRYGSPGR